MKNKTITVCLIFFTITISVIMGLAFKSAITGQCQNFVNLLEVCSTKK